MAGKVKAPINTNYRAPGVAVTQDFRKDTGGRTIKRPVVRGSMKPSAFKSIVVVTLPVSGYKYKVKAVKCEAVDIDTTFVPKGTLARINRIRQAVAAKKSS